MNSIRNGVALLSLAVAFGCGRSIVDLPGSGGSAESTSSTGKGATSGSGGHGGAGAGTSSSSTAAAGGGGAGGEAPITLECTNSNCNTGNDGICECSGYCGTQLAGIKCPPSGPCSCVVLGSEVARCTPDEDAGPTCSLTTGCCARYFAENP